MILLAKLGEIWYSKNKENGKGRGDGTVPESETEDPVPHGLPAAPVR
jgi:hypothetical protein